MSLETLRESAKLIAGTSMTVEDTVPLIVQLMRENRDLEARRILHNYQEAQLPQQIWASWQGLWNIWGACAGMEDIQVSKCDRSEEEIQRIKKRGGLLIFVPKEMSAPEGFQILQKIFPEMDVERSELTANLKSQYQQHGWLEIESSIDAPYTDTTEDQLRKIFKEKGRTGAALNTYLVASQFNRLIKGFYFDQDHISSRLLGTSCGDKIVDARFGLEGNLIISSNLDPERRSRFVGGRSVVTGTVSG